jgi:pimeloyl-ACP methyl ester carboxylesterase
MMAKMAARIPGAKFAVLANCGHLANIEDPDAFDAAILDFLGEVEGRHA